MIRTQISETKELMWIYMSIEFDKYDCFHQKDMIQKDCRVQSKLSSYS